MAVKKSTSKTKTNKKPATSKTKVKTDDKPAINITKHTLVPKHKKLNKTDAENLLKNYNISAHQLPILKQTDPVAIALNAEQGDIVEITRSGPLTDYPFFRRVI